MDQNRSEQQDRLAREIQNGETERIGELWESVRPLVRYFAWKCILSRKSDQPDLEMDALMGAGYLATLRTLEKWNGEKDCHFSAWLHNQLKRAFLEETGGDTAQHRFDNPGFSLDAPVESAAEEGDATLGDTIADPADVIAETEEIIYGQQLRSLLDRAMTYLPKRQEQVLRLRYYDELSLSETGRIMGLKDKEVRCLERRALQAMRYGPDAETVRLAWLGETATAGHREKEYLGGSGKEPPENDTGGASVAGRDWLRGYMDELGLDL